MHILRLICLALLFWMASSAVLFAQSDITRPDFTVKSIETSLGALGENEALTEDQKSQITAFLENATASLGSATKNAATEARFRGELELAATTLENLAAAINAEQAEGIDAPRKSEEPMREEDLLQLEQDLIAKESDLSALRAELEGYEAGLQTVAARQVAAPNELGEARDNLGELTTLITEMGEGELDAVGAARRQSLIARRYALFTQISALEREIAGLTKRQEIVTARRNLAELRLDKLNTEVQYLQDKTGQRRANEAAQVKSAAQTLRDSVEGAHPLVIDMAEGNIQLAQDIVELAIDASNISKRSANARSRLDIVESDLRVARNFIGLGNLDRQAGATLRRLSNQLQSPRLLKSQIDTTQESFVAVTQKRLITQEALRALPPGRPNIEGALLANLVKSSDVGPLSETDKSAYYTLYAKRREMLLRVTNMASTRINEIVGLQNQQEDLLNKTSELKALLDEKLLWVPSVPAINFAWPGKVIKGAFSVFSVDNIKSVSVVLLNQLGLLWLVVLIFAVMIGGCVILRPRIWADIEERAAKIGRVQEDNYWHTPAVILSCVLIALPFPLFFLFLGLLFASSDSPNPLIENVANTSFYLIFFSLLFLTWRAWDRDKSLFGAHYKLPQELRNAVNKNLKWFIPVVGISTALIGFTEDSAAAEIYEGFSLFAFMFTALALAYFGYRVLWRRRKTFSKTFATDSAFLKYRGLITGVIIGLPVIAAGLAAAGYYDTANELLGRLFFSGWLFILTYVVYGLIRRTILVAQRRLALRQAVEKRDAAIRAREEKLAAEEKGEPLPPPPPLDTSAIDIKTISKQSMQLLNTLMVLAFAALMWLIWSELLPALSIFNQVELGQYTTQILDSSGAMIDTQVPITLWSLIQAAVILGLTFIAAKNLPGFLEIFVLSRAGVNAGTRYAVTTILGYVIVAIGIIIGFDRLGLQWSQLRWIVTGLSVGIGFGLQKIIANFISGLIILFERPVRIGDYVTIGDQSGTVSRIQIRATTLSDLDNREILIPNEALISERVTNWTLSNSVTRLIVPVGIAYGSDTDKARQIMLKVLKANPKVLETPAPSVLFTGFGSSSLDFQMRVFLKNFEDRWPLTDSIHTDINKALAKAGISIPFPQTDLHIVSQDIPLEVASKTFKPKTR